MIAALITQGGKLVHVNGFESRKACASFYTLRGRRIARGWRKYGKGRIRISFREIGKDQYDSIRDSIMIRSF